MPGLITSEGRSGQCTKSTTGRPPSAAPSPFAGTRYLQRQHGQGINSWVYTYENTAPLSKAWVGCGLEIGVQLRGSWTLASHSRAAQTYRAAQICRVGLGEKYRLDYEGRTQPGLQVGFILCADQLDTYDGELRFRGDAGFVDRELHDFAVAFAEDPSISDDDTRAALHGYVRRHCELAPVGPLLAAKRELERYFVHDLPVEHLATAGGLHPATFVRRFKATYGMTPVAYRIMLRVNYGARLLWQRPGLTLTEIAEECGFPNVSYFHRTFRRAFGVSAAVSRARLVGDAAA